jgi:hypothetical protein
MPGASEEESATAAISYVEVPTRVAPAAGLEPATKRLTAARSTN